VVSNAYAVVLLIIGLAAAIFGTVLPLGGGSTIALLGAAAFGAGLVLLGIRLEKPSDH
jgi:hypothetical protein